MEKVPSELFLVHQHELEEEIQQLTDELARMGNVLAQFGTELMHTPATVLFSHAPIGLGEIPPELVGAPTVNWDAVPDKVVVARHIKALRRALTRLALLRRQL